MTEPCTYCHEPIDGHDVYDIADCNRQRLEYELLYSCAAGYPINVGHEAWVSLCDKGLLILDMVTPAGLELLGRRPE